MNRLHQNNFIARPLCVVTLTPDCEDQRLVEPVVTKLRELGLSIRMITPISFGLAQVKRLYRGRATHSRSDSDNAVDFIGHQLFLSGRCFLVVGTPPHEMESDFQSLIASSKGRSDYGSRNSDHIRSLSPSSDRAVSLIHSPDDYDGVQLELQDRLTDTERYRISISPDELTADDVSLLVPKLKSTHPLEPLRTSFNYLLGLSICSASMRAGATRITDLAKRALAILERPELQYGEVQTIWLNWLDAKPIFLEISDIYATEAVGGIATAALSSAYRLSSIALSYREFNATVAFEFTTVLARLHSPLNAVQRHRIHALAAFHGAGL